METENQEKLIYQNNSKTLELKCEQKQNRNRNDKKKTQKKQTKKQIGS